jgi:hypothetical protein
MGEDEADYGRSANARLREYNVFVQFTNDGRALARRAGILSAYVTGFEGHEPLAGLEHIADGQLPDTTRLRSPDRRRSRTDRVGA